MHREDTNIDYIWQSFLDGDDASFSILYRSHVKSLLEYGHKLSHDHELINDCLQEIFIDLFLKRDKENNTINNLKSYLFISFRNSLIKKISNARRFDSISIGKKNIDIKFTIEYPQQSSLISEEISTEVSKELYKAVNKLPSKQKEIVYLKFEEGMDYSEISDIMEISTESARKLMYRALLSLRKIVDPSLVYAYFLIFSKKS